MFLKENNKEFTEYEEDKIYIKERRRCARRECHRTFPQSLFFWICVIPTTPATTSPPRFVYSKSFYFSTLMSSSWRCWRVPKQKIA